MFFHFACSYITAFQNTWLTLSTVYKKKSAAECDMLTHWLQFVKPFMHKRKRSGHLFTFHMDSTPPRSHKSERVRGEGCSADSLCLTEWKSLDWAHGNAHICTRTLMNVDGAVAVPPLRRTLGALTMSPLLPEALLPSPPSFQHQSFLSFPNQHPTSGRLNFKKNIHSFPSFPYATVPRIWKVLTLNLTSGVE